MKQSFSYDKINYQILMMKDKHTHFHIVPRYSGPRNFAGTIWTDDGWPHIFTSKARHKDPVEQDVLQQVKEEIIKNL
ncbi:hypothetical protein MYX07_04810 [Patescibacteria group bacterium AH-259-L07]|nr:hypothetical protein [Patescibacteria group bacterium AH-259-L07]